MDFKEPFSRFFDHPNCKHNWLFLTVCFLIPVVGPMVALGWIFRCFVAWLDERPEPAFDFQYFADYLKEGLWPTLVSMLVVFVAMILLTPIAFLLFFGLIATMGENPEAAEGLAIATTVLVICGAYLLSFALIGMFLTPAMINSGLRQDFKSGFSLSFIFDFLKRSWAPLLWSQFVLIIMWFVGMFLGYMALIVGVYFVYGIMSFIAWHMHFQVYRHYLSKGGEEIPLAPNLIPQAPPQLPPATNNIDKTSRSIIPP